MTNSVKESNRRSSGTSAVVRLHADPYLQCPHHVPYLTTRPARPSFLPPSYDMKWLVWCVSLAHNREPSQEAASAEPNQTQRVSSYERNHGHSHTPPSRLPHRREEKLFLHPFLYNACWLGSFSNSPKFLR